MGSKPITVRAVKMAVQIKLHDGPMAPRKLISTTEGRKLAAAILRACDEADEQIAAKVLADV